ncbi:GNAT family N-acetyltransferase [Chloroflexota bacterium]
MKNQKIILQTDRLCLRRIKNSDISTLIDLWCDPEVTKHLGGPRDREKIKPLFEEDAENPYAYEYDLWPVEDKQTNEVIGYCGLLEKEVDGIDEIEINYIFTPSAWGNGYASEIGTAIVEYAFTEKKLERLIALIKPENEASEYVAGKIGMKYEKEVVRPGGEKRKVYVIEVEDRKSAA